MDREKRIKLDGQREKRREERHLRERSIKGEGRRPADWSLERKIRGEIKIRVNAEGGKRKLMQGNEMVQLESLK